MELLPKIPPQALDIEKAVLGAMLIDKKGVRDAFDILKINPFYENSHSWIFEAIKKLYLTSKPIDLLTVSNQLKKDKKLEKSGGDNYLIYLTQLISSSAHVEFHCRVILQKYVKRKIIDLSNEMTENAYNESSDIFDLMDSGYRKFNEVYEDIRTGKRSTLLEDYKAVVEHAIKLGKGEVTKGIETPLNTLNNIFNFSNSSLTILGARPSMGKTAFALNCALHCAQKNIATAYYSLEMQSKILTTRLVSSMAELNLKILLENGLTDINDLKKVGDLEKEIERLPLHIISSLKSFNQIVIDIKKLYAENDLKIVFIDYLQLMMNVNKKENREQEISSMSRQLKNLALELNIPIIALSQLSRAVEQRSNKRPLLSDLRESGAIEQDADEVIFLYRPEYYKESEWEDGSSAIGQNEILIQKNRNGTLGSVRCNFFGYIQKFKDIEQVF